MIKIGVDNGNYNTKSSEGMLYASGYAASDREFITPEMQLFFEGKYYAIGERRMRFQQDKTREPDTFLLTLPAIAEAMRKAGTVNAEITLGVGLPIDSYGTQKEAFRRYFMRDNVSFLFEGTAYRCHIVECKEMLIKSLSFIPRAGFCSCCTAKKSAAFGRNEEYRA